MAICPPENSNTALNYDLLRAANYSFSKKDRERLTEAIWDNFVDKEHRSFADEMIAAANPGELEQMYNGYHSVPTPYSNGYQIVVWNSSGTISSAWYREEYRKEHFLKNRDVHIVLAFPANIEDLVGSGILRIELEVDIRQEGEGWVEAVQYSEGTPYRAFHEQKTWEEAEAHCQSKGGHLASVLSEWEQDELENEMIRQPNMWIGGKMVKKGALSWSDGSYPTFTNWQRGAATPLPYCSLQSATLWYKRGCEGQYNFICRLPTNIWNTTNLKLEYKKGELNVSSFQVWYKYRAMNQQSLDTWNEKRMTGFKLSWKIENKNPPMELRTSEVGESFSTLGLGDFDEDFLMHDQNFNASLLLSNDLSKNIGNGSLVVEIQMERRRETIGKAEFFYTEPGFVLFDGRWDQFRDFTWSEAEIFCNNRGGHLASAESIEDKNKTIEIADGRLVWLGGLKIEGKWKWSSNGEQMTENNFYETFEQEPFCLAMQHGISYNRHCQNWLYSFICSLPITTYIEESTTLVQSYNRLQVASVDSIKVGYRYQAPHKGMQRLNISENKTKGGFKIEWYIQNENGSRVSSQQIQQKNKKWKEVVNYPGRHNALCGYPLN